MSNQNKIPETQLILLENWNVDLTTNGKEIVHRSPKMQRLGEDAHPGRSSASVRRRPGRGIQIIGNRSLGWRAPLHLGEKRDDVAP